jgi:predicted RNA binding protein YcfA (HicA-like mRNA interferase family)
MKPMPKRKVVKALRTQRCVKVSEHGKHEKWRCPSPCGQHVTALTRHTEVTAGVVRSLIEDLKCLPTGWLQ